MTENTFIKALIDAGVGAFIATFILAGLYRIASRLGTQFISAQQSQAEALGAQAQSLEGLTRSVQDFVVSDGTEHREMWVFDKLAETVLSILTSEVQVFLNLMRFPMRSY